MQNNDLVWNLDKFQQRQKVEKFILGFENKLCVFSGSVEQIYSNYDIFFPVESNRRLVILPNPYAHHDTFHCIPESSAVPTGLLLVPADENDPAGRLNMLIPMKDGTNNMRKIPLNVGLQLINTKRPKDKPFLPVLMKGDLRELPSRIPCLHLHSLSTNRLSNLSSLELSSIKKVVLDRLNALATRK